MLLVRVPPYLPCSQTFDVMMGVVAEIGRFLRAVGGERRKLIFFHLKGMIFIQI